MDEDEQRERAGHHGAAPAKLADEGHEEDRIRIPEAVRQPERDEGGDDDSPGLALLPTPQSSDGTRQRATPLRPRDPLEGPGLTSGTGDSKGGRSSFGIQNKVPNSARREYGISPLVSSAG